MGIIKDIFIDVCKMKSVRKAKMSSKINFNGHEFLNKPKYSTVLGLMMAPYFAFDTRLDNRILKHATIKDLEVEVPEKKTGSVKEAKAPKKPIFEMLKDLIIDKKMNDEYIN
jgi:cell division protein FtsA